MKHVLGNFKNKEFDIRDQPNFLIPKFIYEARREHYIFWEKSRVSRGKCTTFTYYDWDERSVIIFLEKVNGGLH